MKIETLAILIASAGVMFALLYKKDAGAAFALKPTQYGQSWSDGFMNQDLKQNDAITFI